MSLLANYYLSASGPLGAGDGSSAANAADASTQAKLDAIWASYSGASVNFFYASGLYQTKGWFFQTRETLQSNQGHFGAGMGSTTIQLVGASTLTNDGLIFALDGTATVTNWTCKDMTLDCNALNQPKWTGAGGRVQAISCNAGSNIVIQRVKIINFGTATVGFECFPVLVQSVSGQKNISMTNVVIDSCTFTSPASGNKDGCTCAGIVDNVSSNVFCDASCVISNCTFASCFTTTSGQPGDFSYQHCYGAPTCVGNTATNCNVGFYIEPVVSNFTNLTINISKNTLTNVDRGVYALLHNGATMPSLLVDTDVYTLNSNGTGVQIAGSGGAVATAGSLTVNNCQMTSTGGNSGVRVNSGAQDLFVSVVRVLNCMFSGFSSPTSFNLSLIGDLKVISPITVGQNGTYIVIEPFGAKIVADLVAGSSYYGRLQSVSSGPYNGYTAAMQALVAAFYNVE